MVHCNSLQKKRKSSDKRQIYHDELLHHNVRKRNYVYTIRFNSSVARGQSKKPNFIAFCDLIISFWLVTYLLLERPKKR